MKISIRMSVPLLLILFLAVDVCYGLSPSEKRYIKGVELAIEGEFKKARRQFEKALEVDSFYIPAREGLKLIDDVIDRKIKKETAVHISRGALYAKKGMLDEALAEINEALNIDPNYASAYNDRGIVYIHKDQYARAVADYTRALEIDSGFALAYLNRGLTYSLKGQYEKAIADFSKAVEIDPGDALVYNERGITYYLKKEYEKSWEDVRKAQNLGYQVSPGFLENLRQASGRKQ